MKKISIFIALGLLLIGMSSTYAQVAGPDAYGYTANNTTFSWIDITTKTGAVNVAGLADDNAVGPFSMGFDFRYYWTDYNEVKIGSNGWISFNNVPNISHCFPTIPSPGGNGDNLVCPFMTDLNFAGATNPGEVWYWSNNVDTFIVSYINAPWWVASTPDFNGDNNFQVIFSATDSCITYNYADMDPAAFNDTPGCASDLSTGWENLTGNIGAQIGLETVPGDNSAIKICPPATPLLTIPDATPFWNQNTDNKGNFELINTPIDMTTNIKNVGNGDITNDITVIGKLESLSFSLVWSDTVVVTGGLAVGQDTTIVFPKQATIASEGQYYYTVINAVAGGQDQNPSNNSNVTEINVPGCSGSDEISLSYASPNTPDGSISWSGGGGDDGAAVYIAPPTASTMNSVTMFIRQAAFNPANNSGYNVMIYDDNMGPGLGTLLDSIHVAQGSYTPESEVTTTLTSPISIPAGEGVYIAWMMGGDSVALGTEAFGPISRRTYEVLSGSWAQYRQSTVEDFFIRANVDSAGYCILLANDPSFEEDVNLVAYPNPASNNAKIQFNVPNTADVKITVNSIHGQMVETYNLRNQVAGLHEVDFNAADLNSGIYFINLEMNGRKITRKLVIQK